MSSPSLSFAASPKEGGAANVGGTGLQKHQGVGVMLALNNMLGSRMPSTVVLELAPQALSSAESVGAGRGKESWHSFSDMTGAFVPGGLVSIGSWQWCMEVCGFRKGTLKTLSKAMSLPHPTPGEGAVVSRMGVSADGLVVAIAVVDTDTSSRGEASGCFFPTPGSEESMCVQESYIHVFHMNPRLVSGPEPLPCVTQFTGHYHDCAEAVSPCAVFFIRQAAISCVRACVHSFFPSQYPGPLLLLP